MPRQPHTASAASLALLLIVLVAGCATPTTGAGALPETSPSTCAPPKSDGSETVDNGPTEESSAWQRDMVALQSEIYSAYPNDFAYSGLISAADGFTIAFAGDIPAGAEAMLATATSPYSVETNVGFTEEDMNELSGTIAEVVHPLFPELGVEVGAEPADRVFAINISMGGNSSVELCESIVSAAVADAVAKQLTADGVDFFDFGFEVTASWTMAMPA